MRKCKDCEIEKDESEFHKKRESRQSYCKDCQNARTRQHYQDNKDAYKKRAKDRDKKLRAELAVYKESHPCADCKQFYPSYVMDFDHLRDKKFGVSQKFTRFSADEVWEEIAKCELVCANCHRIRTHVRLAER